MRCGAGAAGSAAAAEMGAHATLLGNWDTLCALCVRACLIMLSNTLLTVATCHLSVTPSTTQPTTTACQHWAWGVEKLPSITAVAGSKVAHQPGQQARRSPGHSASRPVGRGGRPVGTLTASPAFVKQRSTQHKSRTPVCNLACLQSMRHIQNTCSYTPGEDPLARPLQHGSVQLLLSGLYPPELPQHAGTSASQRTGAAMHSHKSAPSCHHHCQGCAVGCAVS